MSTLPEPGSAQPEESGHPPESPISDPEPAELWPLEPWPPQPLPVEEDSIVPVHSADASLDSDGETAAPVETPEAVIAEPPLFGSFTQPEVIHPERIPNIAHVCWLALFLFFSLLGAGLITGVALHFRLFGVSTSQQALSDIHYSLGSQAILYLLTFAASALVFPIFWHTGFFAGLQWQGKTALRLRWRLAAAAFVCFILALVNGVLLPGPADTPIDKIFRAPGAAWLLFGFGVTFAPFFEEMAFRGFLLPALCTAFDWTVERFTHLVPRPLDANGHPQWSLPAMITSSIATSIPFSLMHSEQNGHAIGPLLLLICVSLVLCWARLSTRSLAASVLVHFFYNFMLFSLMLLGTGGFRHLDKM